MVVDLSSKPTIFMTWMLITNNILVLYCFTSLGMCWFLMQNVAVPLHKSSATCLITRCLTPFTVLTVNYNYKNAIKMIESVNDVCIIPPFCKTWMLVSLMKLFPLLDSAKNNHPSEGTLILDDETGRFSRTSSRSELKTIQLSVEFNR